MARLEVSKNYFGLVAPVQNASSLTASMQESGFEIWHHFFSATNIKSGEKAYFFINFMLLNTASASHQALLGHRHCGIVYAGMLNKPQAFSTECFFDEQVVCSKRTLSVRIGNNVCLEDSLVGSIIQDAGQSLNQLGVGSVGSISFDLKMSHIICQEDQSPALFPYVLNGYELYWYTHTLRTAYDGHIVVNEQEFKADKSSVSLGYRDKIWGRSFPNCWIKIYAGHIKSTQHEINQEKSAFLLLCHSVVLWNYDLGKKCRIILTLNGKSYEFSHTSYTHSDPYNEEKTEDGSILLFESTNARHKIKVRVQTQDKNFHALQFPTPQDYLKKILISIPVSIKIELFLMRGIFGSQLIDEIYVSDACFEQG
ncbi:MAG: hypothetical protein ACRCVN_01930 [Spirochaetia bacterium]